MVKKQRHQRGVLSAVVISIIVVAVFSAGVVAYNAIAGASGTGGTKDQLTAVEQDTIIPDGCSKTDETYTPAKIQDPASLTILYDCDNTMDRDTVNTDLQSQYTEDGYTFDSTNEVAQGFGATISYEFSTSSYTVTITK